jgi:hypothetical protein
MEIRLGDIIDDFCIKCKRIMNHAVVSMLNGEPAKVRCRTCHNDHDYRHEQAPPPKVDARKQALFNEMLAKVAPGETAAPVPETAVEDPPEDIPEELPDELPEEPAEDMPPVEEPTPKKVKAAPAKAPAKDTKPPAKAPAKDKAKPKGRK